MLYIKRKKGQSIIIGDNIEITVSSISQNTVSIALKSPDNIQILRKELYDKIINQNLSASTSNFDEDR